MLPRYDVQPFLRPNRIGVTPDAGPSSGRRLAAAVSRATRLRPAGQGPGRRGHRRPLSPSATPRREGLRCSAGSHVCPRRATMVEARPFDETSGGAAEYAPTSDAVTCSGHEGASPVPFVSMEADATPLLSRRPVLRRTVRDGLNRTDFGGSEAIMAVLGRPNHGAPRGPGNQSAGPRCIHSNTADPPNALPRRPAAVDQQRDSGDERGRR